MEYKGLLLVCVILGCSYAQDADGGDFAEIYPPNQRVVEGSHVVFTCITSLDQASFSWGKPLRELDERRDDVTITQLAHNMSVLEIPRSHVKRHKRTYSDANVNSFSPGDDLRRRLQIKYTQTRQLLRSYLYSYTNRCTASTSQQTVASNDAKLKVMAASRVHSYYPFINFIRQEDKFAFSSAGEGAVRISSELQCMTTYDKDVAKTKRPLTWRWIRGGNAEIKFTEDFKSGRVELTSDGHLVVNNPVEADYETTYMCVAENSWGTAYGQAFALNKTEAPVPEPRTCRDRNGAEVQHGEVYLPHAHDPCLQCECFYGNQGRCLSVACDAPTCELYTPSTETCCDYTCIGDGAPAEAEEEPTGQCTAYTGETVNEGEIYKPKADPCVTCVCHEGEPVTCASVSCRIPTMSCEHPELVTGECCKFECPDVDDEDSEESLPTALPIMEKPMKKGQCTTFSGDIVNEGEMYKPDADPCVTCICRQGEPVTCASDSCIPPPMSCEHVIPVAGACCEFTCADEVLGHVYVQQVGGSKALVQWKLPASYDESMDKFTSFRVNVFRDLRNMADAHVINVMDRKYVILDELDVNSVYYVMVNATSAMKKAVLMTRTEMFSVKPRSSSSLVLSESLGQMFESRGAIYYNGYSLPRQFSPVNKRPDLQAVLNLQSFHLTEVSKYNESPCPNQECGFLRFYTYDSDGEMVNHVSLMFVDDRDFLWAKAHL